MLKVWLALIGIMISTAACAQGCGDANPNCIVPTRPPGTSDNTAASTAFVTQAIGGGGGAVTSVNTPTGTLTIAPVSGAVNADINLAHANIWSATQTFSGVVMSGIVGSTQCLQVNNTGTISGAGVSCGSGGGAVGSVSNSDGSLTIAPITGAVVASLDVTHANTWSTLQTFGALTATGTVTFGTLSSGITSCVQASTTGVLSLSGAPCGAGGAGAVNDVSNADGSLTISPTTGLVVASIALGHTNVWTIKQEIDSNTAIAANGIDTFALKLNGTLGGGIGLLDAGAVGLWTSGNGTVFHIGFGANGSSVVAAPIKIFSTDPSLEITPPASSFDRGLLIEQTGSGTVTFTNCTACHDSLFALNVISIDSDDINVPPANGPGVAGLAIAQKWGGANAHGQRGPLYVSAELTAADASTGNTFGHNNVPATFVGYSNVNDGGNNPNVVGNNFAMNPKCILGPNATFWNINMCAEVDVEVDLGASLAVNVGWEIYEGDNHRTQGVTYDTAYSFSGTGVGFLCGYCATDIYGNGVTGPIPTNGTFVGTQFRTHSPYSINIGIDLTGFTMNQQIKGSTFIVRGAGRVGAAGYDIVDSTLTTIAAGATCPAGTVNGATVAFLNGIVIHC